jgi:hypothetical protein
MKGASKQGKQGKQGKQKQEKQERNCASINEPASHPESQ